MLQLTGVVSEGLGRVTMDKSYQEERLQLTENCQSSGDHLVAGLAGLAHGVLGGLTSVVHQTYQGSVDDGVTVSLLSRLLSHLILHFTSEIFSACSCNRAHCSPAIFVMTSPLDVTVKFVWQLPVVQESLASMADDVMYM